MKWEKAIAMAPVHPTAKMDKRRPTIFIVGKP
jgi:hypothetical protein